MFDNVTFPLIVETVTSSPEFNTTIIPTGSGAEQRNANWADGKITFNAALGVRSKADIQTLIRFFRARKGRARGFLVKDLIDCIAVSTRDIIAVGTTATSEVKFQLQRVYSDIIQTTYYGITGNADLRPIYKPIPGTVQIYKNGTVQTEGGYGAFATASINTGASGVISSVLITLVGSGYTSAPTVGFSGGAGSGVAGTAVLAPFKVTGTTITSGGSGYTSEPSVTFSGGGGSGATGTAVINVGTGLVTGITITDGGTGYTSAPTISFSGGAGSGAAATAITRATIASVTITNGGTGYTSAPTVTFTGGGGTGAAGVSVIGVGYISGIAVNNGGSNYLTPPVVMVSGGGGTGLLATATLTPKSIQSITVTNPGSGYTSAPTVVFSGGGGGSGATATAVLTYGAVSSVTITSAGTGYTTTPTISFTGGGGTGAAATAVIGSSVSSISVTNGGSNFTTIPTVTIINVDGDYSIDYRTGIVYLTTDLANGVSLSWSGEFYVPCRFVEDKLPADEIFFDVFLRDAAGNEISRETAEAAGHVPDVLMMETRDYL